MKEIQTIGIAGAGQMGTGIAQVAAVSGYKVLLYDAFPGVAQNAVFRMQTTLEKLLEKGKLATDTYGFAAVAVQVVDTVEAVAQADLVVEAAVEQIALKRELFAALDRAAAPDVILASNTSSISLTEIASATTRPEKVVGMHFFNPAPVMKLLEVVVGHSTSQETIDTVLAIGARMNKVSVQSKDKAGFIVNRLLDPMLNEAVFLLEEGVGTAEDIDNGMKFGCNHPMGPLALADLIGLDILLAVMEVLYREYADSKYRPAPLLKKMVRAGKLGKKSGEGFYKY